MDYGGTKVAFVGITTPESFEKSTPAYFQDDNGNFIYSFSEDKDGSALYKTVQTTVDAAKAEGAKYVIAIAHLGMDGTTEYWTSEAVIQNTTGIDAMLDGHSHEEYSKTVANKDGDNVVLAQTKTKLAITDKFSAELDKVVGKSEVDLPDSDENGKRLVRNSETALGDLAADAFRIMMDADIGIMNGGGLRAAIPAGDITLGTLFKVFPWGNLPCKVAVTGQTILDMLELGASKYPKENGGFLSVSGLKYTIAYGVAPSIETTDQGEFVRVTGARRVTNVQVLNKATGKYEPINVK